MPKTQKELDEENMFEDQGNQSEGEDKKQESQEQGKPNSQNSGTDTEFSHDLLKGKSPREIEEYVRALELTTKEQGSQLTRQHNQRLAPVEERVRKPEKKITSAEFFEDPNGTIESTVARILKEQLDESILPFKQDMAAQRANQVWVDFAEEHPDVSSYKPLMKSMMEGAGITNPNSGTLEAFYLMAYAKAAIDGKKAGNREEDDDNPRKPARRDPPPQHRASNQPLKENNGGKQRRKLTETERTVARMQGFNVNTEAGVAEYLDLLDENDEDIPEKKVEAKK